MLDFFIVEMEHNSLSYVFPSQWKRLTPSQKSSCKVNPKLGQSPAYQILFTLISVFAMYQLSNFQTILNAIWNSILTLSKMDDLRERIPRSVPSKS